jgi:hypothetical protein
MLLEVHALLRVPLETFHTGQVSLGHPRPLKLHLRIQLNSSFLDMIDKTLHTSEFGD